MKRPLSLYTLYLLLFVLSASSLVCGAMMMAQTDGALLLLDLENLSRTPFKNYGLPGLILFVSGGVIPFLALVGSIFKPTSFIINLLNIYRHMHWGWAYSLYSGIMIIIWIVVQQLTTPYLWLQPLFVLLGLLIIICSLLPSNIKYFKLS